MGTLRGEDVDPVPADAVLLRAMTRGDVPQLAALAGEAGRNVAAHDYERFIALEGARGFVLERSGRLVGGATMMRYFEHGFLGPVVLGRDGDAAGFAIALYAHLVETLQREGVHVVEAEATANEEAILQRMGFEAVRRTIILERAGEAPARSDETRALETRHLLDVGSLDADAVGYGRKDYLAALARECPEGARVLEQDGEVVGYALVRRALRGFHLGPVVTRALDGQLAATLVRDALAATEGEPVVVLATNDVRALAILEREGFEPVGSLARMRAGSREAPREASAGSAHEWATGGRITG